MTDAAPLAEAVAALSHYFVGDATMGDTLRRVAELTVLAVPQARSSVSP